MTEQQADDHIIARGGDPGPLKLTMAEAAALNNEPINISSTEDVIIDSPSVIECEFMASFDMLALRQFTINQKHGFYDKPVDDGTRIALIHSELSEALEADRHGNPPDDKIPEFIGMEAELADAVLRIMDFSVHRNLRVGQALVAKLKYNAGRPRMHGGKKY